MSTNNTSGLNVSVVPPVVDWHEHDHRSHVVQFYEADNSLLDDVSRFIGTALGAGDSAIVIATEPHRLEIHRRLRARGFDPAQTIEQGRYIAVDAAETLAKFMRRGRPNAKLFEQVVGSLMDHARLSAEGPASRVVAFGEMVALLWEEGRQQAAIQLEHLWNELAKTHALSLRCAYPIRRFDRSEHGDAFLKICEAHSAVVPTETYTALESHDDRLLNISHLQQKAQALEAEVAERRKAEARLQAAKDDLEAIVEHRTSSLRRLSTQILCLQDLERRRIARELHDGLGQYLAAAKINLDVLLSSKETANSEFLSEANSLLGQAVAEIRTLSYLLHPPMMDEVGLFAAAQWYVEGFGERSGLKATCDVPPTPGRLPDQVEVALFRILQEALTNVHRHSGATNAAVLLLQDPDQVTLLINDNGKGIARESLERFRQTGAGVGVGLAGMRERAHELGGRFTVESTPGSTSVRVTIPVTAST